MGMTMVEKILAGATHKPSVMAGDVVEPEVGLAMSHENAALVINQFREVYKDTGKEAKVWDPSRIAIIFDHRVPAESSKTATNQKRIREFVAAQGITKFHDIRGDEGGICHQILPESGYVLPGKVVVGTDSHTTSHGALGAFAFGIGATEMASVWALGIVLNVEVPKTIKVVAKGRFPKYVAPKDLILYLIGRISAEGANFKVLEFHGPAFKSMSTSGRLTVCNMSVEAGATSGIVPPDEETLRYLREEAKVKGKIEVFGPDPDASYDQSRRDRRLQARTPGRLPAHRGQCQACRQGRGPQGQPGRHRLLHQRPARRSGGRGEDRQGQKSGPRDAHARFPGLLQDIQASSRRRLCCRLHQGRGRGHEPRLRALPGRPSGRPGRRRSRPGHDEPELQGPDGQSQRRGLPLVAGRGGRERPHGRHHRPEERRQVTWPRWF